MEKFIITEEMLKNARSYVPIEEKAQFIGETASRCFDRININSGSEIALPPMYSESTFLKSRYMMAALLKLYFGIDYKTESEDSPWLISYEDYDYYAGSHMMNQLERMKSNAKLRDKCFDLMSDYKDLERKLNAEVFGFMHAMNDILGRTSALVSQLVTPELTQELINTLNAMADEVATGALAPAT